MSLFDQIGNSRSMEGNLQKLKQDPKAALTQAGVNVPDQLIGNPQAMVMHLIQSGQVGGPALQKVMPMIQRLLGK